jgi:type II secretory pathway pseudopilin PulG
MNTRAFSLGEILTTVLVIGFLAAVVGVRVTGARRAAYMATMQADLRNLMTAQGAYFRTTRSGEKGPRYARTLEELAFVPRKDVVIEMRASTNGWAARAEHKRLRPEKHHCAVYVGDVEPFAPATTEGVLECQPQRKRKEADPRHLTG